MDELGTTNDNESENIDPGKDRFTDAMMVNVKEKVHLLQRNRLDKRRDVTDA